MLDLAPYQRPQRHSPLRLRLLPQLRQALHPQIRAGNCSIIGKLLIEFGAREMRHQIVAWLNAHVQRPNMRKVYRPRPRFRRGLYRRARGAQVRTTRGRTSSRGAAPYVQHRHGGCALRRSRPRGVADRRGMTPAEVVDRHTSTSYPVEFFGFAPGRRTWAVVAAVGSSPPT